MADTISQLMRQANELRFSQPQDALRLYGAAADLSRQNGLRHQLIQALKGQGQIERDQRQIGEALALYEEAASLCREAGDALLLAHTLRHVADIHQDEGRNDRALPFYEQALAIYRKQRDTNLLDLANTVRPLAALKERMGAVNDAKRLWQEAKDLYLATNISQGVAECSRRLAGLGGMSDKL